MTKHRRWVHCGNVGGAKGGGSNVGGVKGGGSGGSGEEGGWVGGGNYDSAPGL